MKTRKTTTKPKNLRAATKRSAVAAAPTGSAPLRMIRLVVQLTDTPNNRRVVDALQHAAKATAVQGPHAAIKREDVQILSLFTTPPRQNVEMNHSPKPLTHDQPDAAK